MPYIAFRHTGDLGDVIIAPRAVRAMVGAGRATLLFARSNGTREPMMPGQVALLKPLLDVQPYVREVRMWRGEDAVDLDRFRNGPTSHWNLADPHREAAGVPCAERTKAWLSVDRADRLPGRPVLFNRAGRYRNPSFDWGRVWRRYRDGDCFVGPAGEYEQFCREVGEVPFVPTRDLLELARLIAGCELYVGDRSGPHAVAEGLGHPRIILEACLGATGAVDRNSELPEVHPTPPRVLWAVPTLSRADLLNRHYAGYREWVGEGEHLLLLDNGGGQDIRLPPSDRLIVRRPARNLGVPRSWNEAMRWAFGGDPAAKPAYDALCSLQDDIGWEPATRRRGPPPAHGAPGRGPVPRASPVQRPGPPPADLVRRRGVRRVVRTVLLRGRRLRPADDCRRSRVRAVRRTGPDARQHHREDDQAAVVRGRKAAVRSQVGLRLLRQPAAVSGVRDEPRVRPRLAGW